MSNPPVCGFPSPRILLAEIDVGRVNLTRFVRDCPEVCSIAWGTGNPDLSGMGVTISYMVQITFILLFCLLFALLNFKSRWILPPQVVKRIEKLHNTFLDTTGIFAISSSVSALVYTLNTPSIFDITFLHPFLMMQSIGLIVTVLVNWILVPQKKVHRRMIRFVFYCVGWCLFPGLSFSLYAPPMSWNSINRLGQHCHGYAQLLPHWGKPSTDDTLKFVRYYAAAACLFILPYTSSLEGQSTSSQPPSVVIVVVALAFEMLHYLREMETQQSRLRLLTGIENQDWGFGQIVALFIWTPLITQTCYYLAVTLWEFPIRRTAIKEKEKEEIRETVEEGSDQQAGGV
ncbi:hypothetical protein BDN72DRAFT_843032 [Pluteus cervinus]|uniref:Uncharacterized protein n=1 Tax=Pluteus cervinus TaxID=181527 RepID=A0ACD3ANS8_9AGAR|nr:hypothetical protein BDN72DRAFT_843032 [Pluteus cervinus]